MSTLSLLSRKIPMLFVKVRSVIKFSHSSPLCINRVFFVDTQYSKILPFFLCHIFCQSAKMDFNKKVGFLGKDYLSMKRNPLDVQNPHE